MSQAASGLTAPARTFVPTGLHEVISSLATQSDGRLAILEDQTLNNLRTCRIVIEPANAGGIWQNWFCSLNQPTIPIGIGRNTFGGVDVLYDDLNLNLNPIKRFAGNGAVVSALNLGVQARVLGTNTDSNGYDYIVAFTSSALEVIKYAQTATSAANPLADFTVPLGGNAWAGAAAPNGTLYFVNQAFPNQSIVAISGGAVTQTIGPFPTWHLQSVAVDAFGRLYVARNPDPATNSAAPNIRVYAPDANGIQQPLKTITPQLTAGTTLMAITTDN